MQPMRIAIEGPTQGFQVPGVTNEESLFAWRQCPNGFSRSPLKREVKLGKGTHLLHLQDGRRALYRETLAFLGDADRQPAGVS